jgi:hypothetical protein
MIVMVFLGSSKTKTLLEYRSSNISDTSNKQYKMNAIERLNNVTLESENREQITSTKFCKVNLNKFI